MVHSYIGFTEESMRNAAINEHDAAKAAEDPEPADEDACADAEGEEEEQLVQDQEIDESEDKQLDFNQFKFQKWIATCCNYD